MGKRLYAPFSLIEAMTAVSYSAKWQVCIKHMHQCSIDTAPSERNIVNYQFFDSFICCV